MLDPCLSPGNTIDIAIDAKTNDYSDLVEFSLNVLESIVDQPVPQTACTGQAATFAITDFFFNRSFQWQVERTYMEENWNDLSTLWMQLPGDRRVRTLNSSYHDSVQVLVDGGTGPQGLRIRCRLSNSCGNYYSKPTLLKVCASDFNCDGLVDDSDFVGFVSAYNILLCSDPAIGANCIWDLNTDQLVDDRDFLRFVQAYNDLICP